MVTTAIQPHVASVVAPYYAERNEAVLHRYFEDEFVATFLEDLRQHRLTTPARTAWQQDDRMGPEAAHLTLRRPVHRAHYLVSSEVVCDRLGSPPLSPRHVASAGFVVRRLHKGGELAWWVEGGVPQGWRATTGPDLEPDLQRRALAYRNAPSPDDTLPYSGEATHPLHTTTATDPAGTTRTLVYGYVPVGAGSRPAPSTNDEAVADGVLDIMSGLVAGSDKHFNGNRASDAFYPVLQLLVRSYQVGIADRPGNEELDALLLTIPMVRQGFPDPGSLYLFLSGAYDATSPLRSYIEGGDPAGPMAGASYYLDLTDQQLSDLRAAVLARHLAIAREAADDTTEPRYGDPNADHCIVPFVRVRSDGCEHTYFGPRSAPFRVASPFDPDAARPVMIPLPRLSDLMRGKPSANFVAPADLAKKLLGLKSDVTLGKDMVGEGNAFGVQWILSFSIPAVTICAMILLMILISLLHMVFFWLPWVIRLIPVFR